MKLGLPSSHYHSRGSFLNFVHGNIENLYRFIIFSNAFVSDFLNSNIKLKVFIIDLLYSMTKFPTFIEFYTLFVSIIINNKRPNIEP